jgi:hypothetical protein
VGKGLSTEDYTTAENKLAAGLSNTGGNIDLSAYATIASVDLKVDKVVGKSWFQIQKLLVYLVLLILITLLI